MPAWASTLLGVAVGGLLTFLGAIYVEMRRRRAERAKERRDTLAAYLGWLSISVSFVSQWPEVSPPSPLARFRAATIERSPHVRLEDWRRAQEGMRRVVGPNLYEPLYRLVEAYARLTLPPLDADVRRDLHATFEYIERLAERRTQETLNEWPSLRRRLLESISRSGDYAAAEAAEPTEAVARQTREKTGPLSVLLCGTAEIPRRLLSRVLEATAFSTGRQVAGWGIVTSRTS